jgi:hypothetical protein
LRGFSEGGPRTDLRALASDVLDDLLQGFAAPLLPMNLYAAPQASIADYLANWNHQLWYHLDELLRIREGRDERRAAQGPDRWVPGPKPSTEDELANQLQELAKLRRLIDVPPKLIETKAGAVLFEDARIDKPGAWEHLPELAVERDPDLGVAWKGQNPGGDWFWLRQPLPDGVLIEHEVHPKSTIKGGLIIGFAVTPHEGVPLSKASGGVMRDYYANFECYHFSVHRGSTGYCNLRRCGPGLLMLASFDDPCPETRWYKLQIVKSGPQVELRVEGKLVCCYLDLGYVAPTLAGGYFGMRHFQGFYGWERNVRVSGLA